MLRWKIDYAPRTPNLRRPIHPASALHQAMHPINSWFKDPICRPGTSEVDLRNECKIHNAIDISVFPKLKVRNGNPLGCASLKYSQCASGSIAGFQHRQNRTQTRHQRRVLMRWIINYSLEEMCHIFSWIFGIPLIPQGRVATRNVGCSSLLRRPAGFRYILVLKNARGLMHNGEGPFRNASHQSILINATTNNDRCKTANTGSP